MIKAILNWLSPQNKQITTSDELAALIYGNHDVLSNVTVTPETAMTVPAINRGVNLMASMVAMLPLELYARTDDGKKKAQGHRQ